MRAKANYLREFYQKWLDVRAPTLEPSSVYTMKTSVETFMKFMDQRQGVSAADIRDYILFARRAGANGNTIKMSLALLRRFFAWTVFSGIADVNPFSTKGEEIPRVQGCASRKRPFTREQYDRLQRVIAMETDTADRTTRHLSHWRLPTAVGWHTGLRMSDVAALRWGAVNLPAYEITVHPIKRAAVRQKLTIPVEPELWDQLVIARQSAQGEAVCKTMHDLYPRYRWMLVNQFRFLCDKARLGDHSFHSLRHGFVTRMLNAGVDSVVISSITGQSIDTIKLYAHVSTEAKLAALARSAPPAPDSREFLSIL